MQINQHVHDMFPAARELDFRLNTSRTVADVFADRRLQIVEALAGIVKVRDRLHQRFSGKVRQLSQKQTERPCLLKRLLGRPDLVVGLRSLDENVHPPVVAFCVHVAGRAVHRGDQRQCATVDVLLPRAFELRAHVPRDPLDVGHHDAGLPEDVVIDALKNVANRSPGLVERDRVGVVDMAAPVPPAHDEFAVDPEPAGHQRQVVTGGRVLLCHGIARHGERPDDAQRPPAAYFPFMSTLFPSPHLPDPRQHILLEAVDVRRDVFRHGKGRIIHERGQVYGPAQRPAAVRFV